MEGLVFGYVLLEFILIVHCHLKELNMERSVVGTIKAMKLQLFGMKDSQLVKSDLLGMVDDCRPRGRPPRQWIDNITAWSSYTVA